jgi:hypothetical protein
MIAAKSQWIFSTRPMKQPAKKGLKKNNTMFKKTHAPTRNNNDTLSYDLSLMLSLPYF